MINKKYLPSKKFVISLLISLAIIILALLFNYSRQTITKYTNNDFVNSLNNLAEKENIDLDSDGDGLVDWKEGLYGTDPKNPDTDGDGDFDFAEISVNRDPLKPNTAPADKEPNDKIDAAIIENDRKILEEYEKLSETDKISRNLMSNIIAAQPISGEMDEKTMNSIVEQAIAEMPKKTYSGITKITDLILQKTDSINLEKNMVQYIKSYVAETNKLIPILGLDIIIMNSYIIDENPSSKAEMLKLISKYQAIIDNLKKIPVPVAIGYYDVNYHLAVINDLEIILAIDKDVISSDKNSLGIYSNISIYSDTIKRLLSTLTSVDVILKIQR